MKLLVLLASVFSLAGAKTYTYWIEPCLRPETGCEAADLELAEWALEAWARADRKSTRLNSSHIQKSRMPSSA